jgi:hypothetical protein
MELHVQENDAIKSQYRWAKMLRVMYVVPIAVALGGLLTRELIPVLISFAELYVFGILFLRPIRIVTFSSEWFKAVWPNEKDVRYDTIQKIVNISPYSGDLHFMLLIYKQGLLLAKFNFCWVPVDQGIIEHLKAHGVKIRNLWFWQEKN